MKGIGRSPREEADVTYWQHCREVTVDVFDVRKWPVSWRKFSSAAGQLGNLVGMLALVVLSPLMIPFAAYMRGYYARKRVVDLKRFSEEVDDLHK